MGIWEEGKSQDDVKMKAMENKIIYSDNLPVLKNLPSESVDLIYIDPPFNTGKEQSRKQIKVEKDENGDRVGFGGKRYQTEVIGERAYRDYFDDYSGIPGAAISGSLSHSETYRQPLFPYRLSRGALLQNSAG